MYCVVCVCVRVCGSGCGVKLAERGVSRPRVSTWSRISPSPISVFSRTCPARFPTHRHLHHRILIPLSPFLPAPAPQQPYDKAVSPAMDFGSLSKSSNMKRKVRQAEIPTAWRPRGLVQNCRSVTKTRALSWGTAAPGTFFALSSTWHGLNGSLWPWPTVHCPVLMCGMQEEGRRAGCCTRCAATAVAFPSPLPAIPTPPQSRRVSHLLYIQNKSGFTDQHSKARYVPHNVSSGCYRCNLGLDS